MPSINLDLNYFDHPKTKRLVGLLGRGSEVLPIRLWCACGKHYPETGTFTGLTAQEIESQVAWWGRPGQMVEAMLKVGFLEQTDGQFTVHDWSEHASHITVYRQKAQKMAKARWAKQRTNLPPPDASSNASSNASSIHQALLQAMPMQCNAIRNTREDEIPKSPELEISQGSEANFDPLGLAWLFKSLKRSGLTRLETDQALAEEFRALIAQGVTGSEIAAEIKSEKRNRAEAIFELRKRLEPKKARELKPTEVGKDERYNELRQRQIAEWEARNPGKKFPGNA